MADGRRSHRRLLLTAAGVVAFVAAGGGVYTLAPVHGATPEPALGSGVRGPGPGVTPTATRSHAPTATPEPLPKADTVTRAGTPSLPLELQVPFVGGSWPVGLFVVDSHAGPSKKAGSKTISVELGVLNEAGQPLTIAAAGQYKEAISLYTDGHWKGLFFVAFRTAGGKDMLPSDGGGAADLPPGVWAQMHLEVDVAPDEATPELRAGVHNDNMPALALSALSLKPQGQPWAALGAAPTPVTITATPTGGVGPTSKPAA